MGNLVRFISSVRKLGSLQQPDWRYNLAVSEGEGKGGRQSRGAKRSCGSFSVFLSDCGTLETLLLPSCNNMAILGKSPLHRGDPARDGEARLACAILGLLHRKDIWERPSGENNRPPHPAPAPGWKPVLQG